MVDHKVFLGEIFSNLVLQNVLGEEMRELENTAHASAQEFAECHKSLEMALQATDEALRLADEERRQRMSAASKLKLLQAEHTADADSAEALAQEKKKLSLKERELKAALAKATSASQRQAASTHSLKVERQNARLARRTWAANRLAAFCNNSLWSAAHRYFVTWQAFCNLMAPPLPARPSAAAPPRNEDAAAGPSIFVVGAALEAHKKALAARNAEVASLRERVAAFEVKAQLEHARDEALAAAAERAAHASGELLEARRENCELSAELAAARAMIEQYAAQKRLSLEGLEGPIADAVRLSESRGETWIA